MDDPDAKLLSLETALAECRRLRAEIVVLRRLLVDKGIPVLSYARDRVRPTVRAANRSEGVDDQSDKDVKVAPSALGKNDPFVLG